MPEVWSCGEAYEPYVGRWSRMVAREFVPWLGVPPRRSWLDVGCGTGALTETVLALGSPDSVCGVDPSEGYVAFVAAHLRDPRTSFRTGDATALPFADGEFDATVSGLVLNFVPGPARAVAEMARVTRLGGVVGAYVWDYAEAMELMRYFWDAAVELDPSAAELDEGARFPICSPPRLAALFAEGGLNDVEVRAIDVPTPFRDFDDYWSPFLGGQGPAPRYAISLDESRRAALRDRIRAALPIELDGSIRLVARAWAVRGGRR